MPFMMLRRGFAPAVALVLAGLAIGACTPAPEPIRVDAAQIVVQNQTGQEWSKVEIWVNNHYRAQYPVLVAGQRLVVPLDTLVEAHGQQFDRRRQYPQGIEVTAKDSDGRAVRLVWGKGRIR
jgi:hypothetical protein